MVAVRRSRPVLVAVVLALGLAACSSDGKVLPRKAPVLVQSSPYEAAVLADGATAVWPLRDADGLRPGDQVAELTPTRRVGTVVGGTITGTTSPAGARGATFLRSGRIVTPVTAGLTDKDTFTVELALRVDACSSAWGRVLGTSALPETGREGLEVLHFPAQFAKSPCRLAVELWHHGAYVAGCHPPGVLPVGRWAHLAVVYAQRTVSCYLDGRLVGSKQLAPGAVFAQPGPLGIGGSGSGFQGPLDGLSLSEVAVYDRALTLPQVREHSALLRHKPQP